MPLSWSVHLHISAAPGTEGQAVPVYRLHLTDTSLLPALWWSKFLHNDILAETGAVQVNSSGAPLWVWQKDPLNV